MLTSMLEKAIEIEGLLRIIRDGDPLPETYRLLKDKAAELNKAAAELTEPNVEVKQEEPEPDFVMTPSVQEPDLPEVVFDEGDQTSAEASRADLALEDEDDIILSFDDTEEYIPEADPTAALPPQPAADQPSSASSQGLKRNVRIKSLFSLNDRFLYARELFNGNMKAFDSALEGIEGITDYSIIEDYFFNELEWNPEDRNVVSFMEILRPHFKE